MSNLIYLASPYSGTPEKEKERFLEAARATAWIFNKGYFVFSPIASAHPVKELHGLPGDWKFWSEFDKLMIDRCNVVWVLCIDGWDKSVGVTAEIQYCRHITKPVLYLHPKGSEYEIIP